MITELDRIIFIVMAYAFTIGFIGSGLDLLRWIKRDKQTISLKEIAVTLLFPSLFNAVLFGFMIGCADNYNLYFRGRI